MHRRQKYLHRGLLMITEHYDQGRDLFRMFEDFSFMTLLPVSSSSEREHGNFEHHRLHLLYSTSFGVSQCFPMYQ